MVRDLGEIGQDNEATYLPERYRKLVTAKKRRRVLRRLILVCGGITVLLVLLFVFSGFLSGPSLIPQNEISAPAVFAEKNQFPAENITPRATLSIIHGSGLADSPGDGLLSPETALFLITCEYPSGEFTVSRMNLTEVSGKKVYVFDILSGNGAPITPALDAVSGNPYTPGQELANIPQGEAGRRAGNFFLPQKPDQIRARYNDDLGVRPSWKFIFLRNTTVELRGTLDAETGSVTAFTRNVSAEGRPKDPIYSLPAAQKIAERAIYQWNGELPISLINGRYEAGGSSESPMAGRYVFEYTRIASAFPCDSDGITISVDSANGDILGYDRRWNTPGNAFSVTSEVLVSKRDATFAILQNASGQEPDYGADLQVLSAEVRWNDRHDPRITPRPGSIPLAWKVVFDDANLRAMRPERTAIGWVDAQTGSVMSIEYPR